MENDLPFADSFVVGRGSPQEFARRVEYPILAKPRDGFSSQGVLLIENEAQFERALARPNYVFEEYLDKPENYWAFKATIERDGMPLYYLLQGLKHSMQLLYSPDSKLLSAYCTYNRQFVNTRKVTMNHEAHTQSVLERCAAAFTALGWRGPLNIQCQMDKHGQLKIHEFNGRFSGPLPERWILGHDDLAAAIKAFTGLDIPESIWAKQPSPVALARIYARGFHPRDAQSLTRTGQWTPLN
jgi:biotin carboxylase